MKRTAMILAIAACVLMATLAVAQAKPATPGSSGGQGQQQPANGQSSQTAQPAQSTQGQPTVTQAAGPHPPQAKTPQEMTDYTAAASKLDVKDMSQAADEFAVKYPQSELKWMLYQQVMLKAQDANDADVAIDMGRKSIQANPDNALSLAIVAAVISERTHETDLDKAEKETEATKDANHALETAGTMQVAASATPEQVESVRNQVRAFALGALGTLAFNDQKNDQAIDYFRKAMALPVPPDPLNGLRLAVALDKTQKYQDALETLNKVMPTAPDAYQPMLKQEHDRLVKLTGGTPAAGTPPAGAPAGATGTTPPKPPQR